MDITVLLIGVILAGGGLLVKRFPNAISGYRGLTPEKKKNVDIDGLSNHYRNGLLFLGGASVLVYLLIKMVGYPRMAELFYIPLILIGSIVIIAGSFKYDHNEKKTSLKLGLWIMVAVTLFVTALLLYTYVPHKIITGGDSIKITGMYGLEIRKDEVASAEIFDFLPPVRAKTNGSAIAGILKGHFRLDNLGKTRVFTHPNYHGPYLIIKARGETIAVKTPDEQAAEAYLGFLTSGKDRQQNDY